MIKNSSRPSTGSRVSNSRPSTASMTQSKVSTTRYPKCDVKNQHSKEVMNLICVTSTCKNRGPICTLCKASSDHSNHIILPIRSFMEKVKAKLPNSSQLQPTLMQKSQVIQPPIMATQKIQEQPLSSSTLLTKNNDKILKIHQTILTYKNQMLAILNIVVKQIASKIQAIESNILKESATLIETIQNAIEIEQNIQSIVNQYTTTPPEDPELFKAKIKSLLTVVNAKSKDSIEIGSSFEQKIEQFKNRNDNFQKNMEDWMANSMEILKDVYKINEKANTKGKDEGGNKIIKFSTEQKSKSITLINQNKIAKQTDNKQIGFAVIATNPSKYKNIAFKIINIASNIKVGVCLKDIVKTKAYKFSMNAIGHGSYLISNNSYIFSHSDAGLNMQMKGFNFQNGDIIEIQFLGTEIRFQKRNGTNKSIIPIKKLTESQQKQLAYCVWLGGTGDKIQIVE